MRAVAFTYLYNLDDSHKVDRVLVYGQRATGNYRPHSARQSAPLPAFRGDRHHRGKSANRAGVGGATWRGGVHGTRLCGRRVVGGAWIDDAACLYWGDVDTHGYAILHRARSRFPHLVSVMMDEATMLQFSALWTEERSQHAADDFSALTVEERAVYGALRRNTWGKKLRLEQERIGWDIAWPTLKKAVAFNR